METTDNKNYKSTKKLLVYERSNPNNFAKSVEIRDHLQESRQYNFILLAQSNEDYYKDNLFWR